MIEWGWGGGLCAFLSPSLDRMGIWLADTAEGKRLRRSRPLGAGPKVWKAPLSLSILGAGHDCTAQGRHGAHSRGLHGGHPGGAGQEKSQPAVLRLGCPPPLLLGVLLFQIRNKRWFPVSATVFLTIPGLWGLEWGHMREVPSPGAAA